MRGRRLRLGICNDASLLNTIKGIWPLKSQKLKLALTLKSADIQQDSGAKAIDDSVINPNQSI